MKRNKVLRTAAIIMALVLVSTCGMVGTLAKYVDTFATNSGTVRAGLFKVTGPDTSTVVFDATIYDGNNGTEDEAQAYAGLAANKNIIVPGTIIKVNGFPVVNYSEVDVRVTIGDLAFVVNGATEKFDNELLLFSTTGTAGSFTKTLKAATSTDILGGTNAYMDLKSKPAAVAAGDTSNEGSTSEFYILWPFAQDAKNEAGAASKDAVASRNTDTEDTKIGKDQAGVLLTEVPAVAESCNGAGACAFASGGAHDAACVITAATPATYTYGDLETGNTISITATITATQKD